MYRNCVNTLHQLESLHCCCASQLIVMQLQVSVSDCRLAAAHKRDKYEARHVGNFRRIYPSSSAPLQAKYEWLLQGSARLFASSMKAKAHNTIGRIQVPPLAASLLLPLTIQNSMEDIMPSTKYGACSHRVSLLAVTAVNLASPCAWVAASH